MRNNTLILTLLFLLSVTAYAQWPASGTYYVGTPGAHFATLQNFMDSVQALPTAGYSYNVKLKDTIHNVSSIVSRTYQTQFAVHLTFSSVGNSPSNCKIITTDINSYGGTLKFKQISIDFHGTSIGNTPGPSGGGYILFDSSIVHSFNSAARRSGARRVGNGCWWTWWSSCGTWIIL